MHYVAGTYLSAEERSAEIALTRRSLWKEKAVDAPVEPKAVEEKPVEAPVEIKPVEEAPAGTKAVGEKPAETKPVEEKPIEGLIEVKPAGSLQQRRRLQRRSVSRRPSTSVPLR
ncbi:hypothetical protein EDB81DRAFT_768576 [Dactylonectria macrodidyma]|uniref:Uncharacterized protein n=1 Tax=Dactylonectria macrodidyma TaxID=307937 RepID=A0A9P9D2U6_9HYPO|nr:hypothetical protein EDB81DRAFT_768576 [Dactylonectria macrodidyma]